MRFIGICYALRLIFNTHLVFMYLDDFDEVRHFRFLINTLHTYIRRNIHILGIISRMVEPFFVLRLMLRLMLRLISRRNGNLMKLNQTEALLLLLMRPRILHYRDQDSSVLPPPPHPSEGQSLMLSILTYQIL